EFRRAAPPPSVARQGWPRCSRRLLLTLDDEALIDRPGWQCLRRRLEVAGDAAITQRDGDPDHVAVGREILAGHFLEPLHGVHEFHFIVGVLFLERRGIDPAPALFAGASLEATWRGGTLGSVLTRGERLPPLTTGPTVMEEGLGGVRRK